MHAMNGWHGPPNGTGLIDPVALGQFMGQTSEHQRRVMDRLDHQGRVLEWIVERLQDGTVVHHQMDKELALHKADLTAHAADIASLKAAHDKPKDEKPSPMETWLKYAATLLFPAATLWATGSIDKALAVFKAVSGAP